MPKTALTPGKLYAKLSAEFRRLRPADCRSCAMPMLYAIEGVDGDRANWLVERVDRVCDECMPVVAEIVRRYSRKYDIYDPAFTTCIRRPVFVTGSSIPPHRLHSP